MPATLLPTVPTALLVLALVMLLPGAAVMGASGGWSGLPMLLRLPAALVVTQLLFGIAVLLRLVLSTPIDTTIIGVGALSAVCLLLWACRVARARARARTHARENCVGRPGAVGRPGEATPRPGDGAKRWCRRPHWQHLPWLLVAAAVTGSALLGWLVRTSLNGDTMYHAGVVLRLLWQESPTFDSMSRFSDGGPNPAYVLPLWHEAVAVASVLAPGDHLMAVWLTSVVVKPIAVLVMAGLAYALFRSSAAAAIAAVFTLIANQIAGPSDTLGYAAHPGYIAMLIAYPLILATVTEAVNVPAADSRLRWPPMIVAAAGTVAIVALHANYVIFVALALAGYALMWVTQGPRLRSVTRRQLVLGASVSAAALASVAAVFPFIRSLRYYGKGTEADSSVRVLERFSDLIHHQGHSYQMTAGAIVSGRNPFALLGTLAVLLAFIRWRRHPLCWVLVGSTAGLVLAVRSNVLFPQLLDLGNGAMFARMKLLMPTAPGMTLLAMCSAALLTAVWRRHETARALAACVAVLLLLVALTRLLAARQATFAEWAIPAFVVAVAVFLLLGLVGAVRSRVVDAQTHRRRSSQASLQQDPVGRPILAHHGAVAMLVAALLLVAAAPELRVGLERVATAASDRASSPRSSWLFAKYPRRLLAQLDDLEGAVVLTRSQWAWDLQAIAPVYVAGDHKERLADTPANRPLERFQAVERFHRKDAGDQERFSVIEDENVDYVLTRGSGHVRAWLDRHPDRFRHIRTGSGPKLYEVTRGA